MPDMMTIDEAAEQAILRSSDGERRSNLIMKYRNYLRAERKTAELYRLEEQSTVVRMHAARRRLAAEQLLCIAIDTETVI